MTTGVEVMVNARYLTQTTTGVQRYAIEMMKALDVLAERGAADGAPMLRLVAPGNARITDPGLRNILLEQTGRLGGTLWTQFELPRHAKGRLLWSPTNSGPVFHRRHVVTIHDASVLDHPEWFSGKFAAWYRLLLPMLAKNALHVLTVSEFSRQRLIERLKLDPDRVSIAPNGVGGEFHPLTSQDVKATLERLSLPRRYIMSLGSLEPRKNIRRLLDAWSLLLARRAIDEDVHLVLVGGKSANFRDVGLLPLPERVLLTGYMADEDLPALYSGATAFVYPSLYEGFGLPPLEAMACGTPVVASDATSIPEVTGKAAVLVDPHDVESIGKGLRRVMEDAALREELAEAGIERARKFGWEEPANHVWRTLFEMAAV